MEYGRNKLRRKKVSKQWMKEGMKELSVKETKNKWAKKQIEEEMSKGLKW